MSNKLIWSNKDYEGDLVFVADVAHINCPNEPDNLIMYYLIISDKELGFILYFVCNDEMFKIGHYEFFEFATAEANKHKNQLNNLFANT